jgi:hypothetical protein
MLKLGALLFTAALAATTVARASHAPQTNPASHLTNQVATDQRGTERLPLAVKLLNSGRSNAETGEDNRRDDQKAALEKWASEWNIKLTAGLVFVGLLQALAIIYTAFVTNKSATAAQASANAVVSQLRAYIGMRVKQGIPPTFNAEIGPYGAFEVKNTGQTPAFDMIYWIRGGIGPANHHGPLPDSDEDDVAPQPMTLAPGSSVDIASTGPVPDANVVAAFEQGLMAAYIWGEIEYTDAFKNRRFHNFRYKFTAADIAGPIVHIGICEEGNEAN